MKAAIFQGKGKVEIGKRPDPILVEPTDVIVRVVLACVCGSDLWYYRGSLLSRLVAQSVMSLSHSSRLGEHHSSAKEILYGARRFSL
jgi:threonine dehydrogenase-like Zn-dependent dehydrogenase